MVYEFLCKPCNAIDEIELTIDQRDDEVACPECSVIMKRMLSKPNVITKGPQHPYFHPAFGKVLTDKEAQQEAKSRGWVEVGNEDVRKHTPGPSRKAYDADDYFL